MLDFEPTYMSNGLLKKDHCDDRFLLSFSGKYLAYDYSPASSRVQTEGITASNLDHQLYKIQVPHTEADCFGPLFIEVEDLLYLHSFVHFSLDPQLMSCNFF